MAKPADAPLDDAEKIITSEVVSMLNLEAQYNTTKNELMADERLKQFFELEAKIRLEAPKIWAAVQAQMELHNIKSIKGDWGSITVAERTSYKVDEDKLPAEYKTMKPDLKKIGAAYSLMDEAPDGVTPQTTRYLVKRFKKGEK